MLDKFLEKTERLIRRIRVPRCKVPFAVLFQERSGSSHLCSMLSNHLQIACRQESFYEVPVDQNDSNAIDFGNQHYRREVNPFLGKPVISPDKRRVVAHVHDIFSCPVTASGFKFKYPLQPVLFPEVIPELKQFGADLRVIALKRANVLKQSISRQNMLRIQSVGSNSGLLHANLWDHNATKEIEFPFQINVPETVQYAQQLIREQAGFDELVGQFRPDVPVLDVEYESLLADQANVVRQAFEFLEVDPDATIYSSVSKATPNDLKETISNLDELSQAIRGSDLEIFLD